MKRYIRPFAFLFTFLLILTTAFGDAEDTPPALIQALLKQEGATLADLQTNPELRKRVRQHLYRMKGEPMPRQNRSRMPRRTRAKLPPYCQVIVDNNLFRPLGYRKHEWTLKLELIGTMIYPDASKNTAILMSNHPKYRRLIVKTGDTFIEELTLTKIEARQITYTNKAGKAKTIRLRSLFDRQTPEPPSRS